MLKRIFILLSFLSVLFVKSITQQKVSLVSATSGGTGTGTTLPAPDIDKSIIPQQPDVAAFTKYGDIPVNLSVGMVNFSVPILNTKVGKLPINIELDYGYQGYRPSEFPSWVGLGWQLNVGGVISRAVRGRVDGDNTSGAPAQYPLLDNIPDLSMFTDEQVNQQFLTEIGNHSRDAEPDIYSYSFPGHSGRFVFKNGRALIFPYDNIVISKNGIGFTIVTEDGTTYLFLDTETTTALTGGTSSPASTYISAWHLSKIFSINNIDLMSFYYKSIKYVDYVTQNSQQASYDDILGSRVSETTVSGGQLVPNQPTIIMGLQLNSITCSNQANNYSANNMVINFDLDTLNPRKDINPSSVLYPLKGIRVYNLLEQLMRQASFNYNYFNGTGGNNANKLKLSQLTIFNPFSTDTTQKYSYQFNYENESTTFPYAYTNGLDLYGYYDGNDANQSLTFSTPNYGFLPAQLITMTPQDRSSNLAYCKYGVLNKITYPTDGYTTLSYELNPKGPGIRLQKFVSSDPITNSYAAKTYKYTLSDGITPSIVFLGGSNSYTPFSNYVVYSWSPSITQTTQYTANLNNFLSDPYHLENHPFYYSTVTEIDSTPTELHKSVYNFNTYQSGWTNIYQTSTAQYKQNAGTFKLLHFDSMRYNLQVDTFLMAFQTKLEKVWITPGLAGFYNSGWVTPDGIARFIMYSCTPYPYALWSYFNMLSAKTSTMYDDNGNSVTEQHLYYYDNPLHKQVTREYFIRSNGDSLITMYKYPLDYPSGCDKTYPEQQFKSDLNSIRQMYYSCVVGQSRCNTATCYNSYNCQTNAINAFSTIVQNWQTNKQNYFSCLNNSIASEYNPAMRAVKQMQSENWLNTPIEKIQYLKFKGSGNADPQLVEAVKTDYVSGNLSPQTLWATDVNVGITLSQFSANPTNYYKQRVNFTYDNNYNIIGQYKQGDMHETYLWSYGGLYPVAKIVGGNNLSSDTSIVSQSQIDASINSDAQMRTVLNNLRSSLPNALVTTYTYSPLIGMTSQTDPLGRTTYYEYDGLARLQRVRDQDNNIVKQYAYQYNYSGADAINNTPVSLSCTNDGGGVCSATYYNIVTGKSYTFTIPASGGVIGSVPPGTYNVTFTPPATFKWINMYTICSHTASSKTAVTISNVNISSTTCNTVAIEGP